MNMVDKKYKRLSPKVEYLADEVVLVQAWKKSQRSIRRVNWYADLLALDQSAILLDKRIEAWQNEIKNKNATPTPMRLVPAPKTHRWGFVKETWQAMEKDKNGKRKPIILRPLAHLGIREQTMATAAMLCLADCIETAQGDTSTEYFEASRQGIHSYGSRLFCSFDRETLGKKNRPLACFNWGNSETYSRYYQDYRRFLERPLFIAEKTQDVLGEHGKLFIIKLDISTFYDCIHLETLKNRLEKEYEEFQNNYSLQESDQEFWNSLGQIMSWSWNRADYSLSSYLKGNKLPVGLPQGLLASGFLANAYMLEFDRSFNGLLRKPGSDMEFLGCNSNDNNNLWKNIIVHDYCRYVDDIRLVMSVDKFSPNSKRKIEEELADVITKWMNSRLELTATPNNVSEDYHLKINPGKTEVTPFRLVAGRTGVAARMAMIQNNLSGPMDMDTLRETTIGLGELLMGADCFDCNSDQTENVTHPLARITTPKSDVRDDTLKRFVAFRLRNALRHYRSMTDLNVKLATGVGAKDAIDHEIEVYARKLVRAWSHDPALSLVLRLGMDLFPSPNLLKPVLDSLSKLVKTSSKSSTHTARILVAWYVIADLLRAGAVETGLHARDGEIPDTADLIAYQAMLLNFSKQHVINNKNAPWYVLQQALLLLATLEPCPMALKDSQSEEISNYKALLSAASYTVEPSLTGERLVIGMVFQQLRKDKIRFSVWFLDSLLELEQSKRIEYLKIVSFNRPDLMEAVLREIEQRKLDWIDLKHDYLKMPPGLRHASRDLSDFDGITLPLWNIITHIDNPFRHEISWLRLGKALIKMLSQPQYIKCPVTKLSLRHININVRKWNDLGKPGFSENAITVTLEDGVSEDPRLIQPSWCEDKWVCFYALGRLLRSAITGDQDFTITPYLQHHDWDSYRGMRNSWYTRRMGMIHSPEILGGDAAPFSPWVSELLMQLLQWPGARTETKLIERWKEIQSLEDLSRILNFRLTELEKLYGRASNLPVYPIIIGHTPHRDGILRVVLAQTLIPKQQDFTVADPCLSHRDYRSVHRNHLSTICSLILSQLKAQYVSEGDYTKDKPPPLADLIVFPELSVHPDDVWILKRLSNVTKAMIFFGLTPIQQSGGIIVNTACWLIPDRRSTGRSWVIRKQGKRHPTDAEKKCAIVAWRPYQVVIELPKPKGSERGYRITGAICYDATDLELATDMKNVSDLFVISAMNKDVSTFDNMVASLQFLMYQHVVLVNTGEFGGSTVQAPFLDRHEKVVSHLHGGGKVGVSVVDIDVTDFGPSANSVVHSRKKKTPPANFSRFK